MVSNGPIMKTQLSTIVSIPILYSCLLQNARLCVNFQSLSITAIRYSSLSAVYVRKKYLQNLPLRESITVVLLNRNLLVDLFTFLARSRRRFSSDRPIITRVGQ